MVSSITAAAYPTDEHGRPFRRRRWIPWASAVAGLVLVMIVVWTTALSTGGSSATAASCPAPPAPSSTPPSPANPGEPGDGAATTQPASFGSTISRAQMKTVAPAALASFQIRVLNATSQRGAASKVLGDLTDEGFVPVPEPSAADDPVYYDRSLDCYGQIRFGAAGVAAAASVWIAAPCNELIQDSRPGTQVDLVLGNQYKSNQRSQDASALLATLKSANPRDKNTGVDPALLSAVHKTKC